MIINLSAFEKERIVPQALGSTPLGQDMLAEDYLLKQLTASLTNPDTEIGRAFWDKVYSAVQLQFGTTDVPVDLVNKVWIVPEKAVVFRQGNAVYVLEQKLKVLTEADHGAKSNSAMPTWGHDAPPADTNERGFVSPRPLPTSQPTNVKATQVPNPPPYPTQDIATKTLRNIIIPIIEHEVNTGAQFATLRQIYNAMILAAWYKKNLRRTIIGEGYIDKSGVTGVLSPDRQAKERTYSEYLQSFNKGAYNFIREDKDAVTGNIVPRKYFSGGLVGVDGSMVSELADPAGLAAGQDTSGRPAPGDVAVLVQLSHESDHGLSGDALMKAVESVSRDPLEAVYDTGLQSRAFDDGGVNGTLVGKTGVVSSQNPLNMDVLNDTGESIVQIVFSDSRQGSIKQVKRFDQLPQYPDAVEVRQSGKQKLVLIRDFNAPLVVARIAAPGVAPQIAWFDEKGDKYREEVLDEAWVTAREKGLSFNGDPALLPILKLLWRVATPMDGRKIADLIYSQSYSSVGSGNNSTREGRLAYTEPVIRKLIEGREMVEIKDVADSDAGTTLDLAKMMLNRKGRVVGTDIRHGLVMAQGGTDYTVFLGDGVVKDYTRANSLKTEATHLWDPVRQTKMQGLVEAGKFVVFHRTAPQVDEFMRQYPGRLQVGREDVFYPALHRGRFDLIRVANILRHLPGAEISALRAQGIVLKEGGHLLLSYDDYGSGSQQYSVWRREGMELVSVEGKYLQERLPKSIPLAGPIREYGSKNLLGWVTDNGDVLSVRYNNRYFVSWQSADGEHLTWQKVVDQIDRLPIEKLKLITWFGEDPQVAADKLKAQLLAAVRRDSVDPSERSVSPKSNVVMAPDPAEKLGGLESLPLNEHRVSPVIDLIDWPPVSPKVFHQAAKDNITKHHVRDLLGYEESAIYRRARKVMIMGGHYFEFIELGEQLFPERQATLTFVNVSQERLSDIEIIYSRGAYPHSWQAVYLFRANGADLGRQYFEDGSYDFWYMDGIDESAFSLQVPNVYGMLDGIVREAVRLVAPGGYIYDGDSYNKLYWGPWVDKGYLKEAHDGPLFLRTDKPWTDASAGQAATDVAGSAKVSLVTKDQAGSTVQAPVAPQWDSADRYQKAMDAADYFLDLQFAAAKLCKGTGLVWVMGKDNKPHLTNLSGVLFGRDDLQPAIFHDFLNFYWWLVRDNFGQVKRLGMTEGRWDSLKEDIARIEDAFIQSQFALEVALSLDYRDYARIVAKYSGQDETHAVPYEAAILYLLNRTFPVPGTDYENFRAAVQKILNEWPKVKQALYEGLDLKPANGDSQGTKGSIDSVKTARNDGWLRRSWKALRARNIFPPAGVKAVRAVSAVIVAGELLVLTALSIKESETDPDHPSMDDLQAARIERDDFTLLKIVMSFAEHSAWKAAGAGQWSNERVEKILRMTLTVQRTSPLPEYRIDAIKVLKKFLEPDYGKLAPETIIRHIAFSLRDPVKSVRLAAVNELGSFSHPRALTVLDPVARNDLDEEVRKAAQRAIQKIEGLSSPQGKASYGGIDFAGLGFVVTEGGALDLDWPKTLPDGHPVLNDLTPIVVGIVPAASVPGLVAAGVR
ncbi:MAG: HEAT repeat domain-containing protein [Candidatus Omnitrophica bacterium]|nr:HEAT repeat domain-containing protein [Candidatus Omnitrophota bacterium]